MSNKKFLVEEYVSESSKADPHTARVQGGFCVGDFCKINTKSINLIFSIPWNSFIFMSALRDKTQLVYFMGEDRDELLRPLECVNCIDKSLALETLPSKTSGRLLVKHRDQEIAQIKE